MGSEGKRVALAVVVNKAGVVVVSVAGDGTVDSSGDVTPAVVRDLIEKDLARYPELRSKAAAIDEIVILSDEAVSPSSYAQDMMQCYVRQMAAGGWAEPEGLHIFESFLGPVVVYTAYGI